MIRVLIQNSVLKSGISNLELMSSNILESLYVQLSILYKTNESSKISMNQTLIETYDCTYFLKGMSGRI